MSGVLRNDCRNRPVDVYNYTWLDGHLQPSIWCQNTVAEATLRFHGVTTIRPSRQTLTGQALFGTSVKCAIEFDRIELDLNVVFASLFCKGKTVIKNVSMGHQVQDTCSKPKGVLVVCRPILKVGRSP
jgi:hypothetical protein